MIKIQDVDETLQALLDLQAETEQAVKEQGEALNTFIEKRNQVQANLGRLALGATASPQSKANPAPKAVKAVGTDGRRGKKGKNDNEISLKEAITTVLKRHKNGIAVAQIVEIIDSEKLWKTDGHLSNQIQSNLYAMKKAGLVERDNNTGTYALA